MKILKVNNFANYLIFRILITLVICFVTYNITGRIADTEILSGLVNLQESGYQASGSRTIAALYFYSLFFESKNLFLIITLIAIITSNLMYLLIRRYIDNLNINYWYILLISPGILLYTNTPTKESIIFYPAIAVIILECESLINWRRWNNDQRIINLFFKIITSIMILQFRGDLGLIYIILSILIFLLSNFQIKTITQRIDIRKGILIAFIISNILFFIFNNLYPISCENIINYLISSFGTNNSTLSRNYIDYQFLVNPLNSLRIIYLGLFPTINEVISKPYAMLIVFESLIYIILYFKIWNNLFKVVHKDHKLKTVLYFCFVIITIFYFLIYSHVSVFNIGSGQRLKINFIPAGLIFPLIIEKQIRSLKIRR